MRLFRLTISAALMALGMSMTMLGCGDDGCEELAAICELCPTDTTDGIVARDSCERTVAAGDDESCTDRVDRDTYSVFGCQ